MSHKPKFEKDYYERCASEGMDYAYYGNWQKQYVKMVIFVTQIYMNDLSNKVFLDVGTACGATLLAFKETKIFEKCIGIDTSEFLVALGNEKFNFKKGELIVENSTTMESIKDNSIDLLHCSQLFEYLSESDANITLEQFKRVMKTGSIGFINISTIKEKQNKSQLTMLSEKVWKEKIKEYGFTLKKDTIKLMKQAAFFPGNDKRNFYEHYIDDWSVFTLTK